MKHRAIEDLDRLRRSDPARWPTGLAEAFEDSAGELRGCECGWAERDPEIAQRSLASCVALPYAVGATGGVTLGVRARETGNARLRNAAPVVVSERHGLYRDDAAPGGVWLCT
ncbi:MAG: hypothetical protein ACE5I7_10960 [Candidatus Binatia bacterium]